MPTVRQLPAKLDLECIAGDPFTVTITATGITTLTSPAVTMTTSGGDAYTTDPGIPTASVAGLAVTSAWSTADTAALNATTRGKTYRYSIAANPDSAGLFEIVAGTLTVHPVGHAGTSSASSATLAVTVGTTAVSLAVALGGGGGGGGATTLDDLTDVTITSAASGDILRHNGTAWVDAVGTTHFEVAGAAATAQAAAEATAAAALAGHVAAADPHTGYVLSSEIGTAVQAFDADLSTIAAANNGAVLAATTASFTTADETKLDGIATGATVYTDEMARDALGTALVAGSNITITPNDGADTITIAATGGGSSDPLDGNSIIVTRVFAR